MLYHHHTITAPIAHAVSCILFCRVVWLYRVACHYGDTEAEVDATMRISSAAVYNKVMLFMLKEADGSFKRMLSSNTPTQTPPSTAGKGSKGKKQQKAKQQALDATAAGPSTSSSTWTANEVLKAPRWKKVSPLVKSYLGNSLHLLSQMTESAMLAFTLRRLRASTAFLASFSKIQRRLLKTALQLFGSADNAPRVQVGHSNGNNPLISLLLVMMGRTPSDVAAVCHAGHPVHQRHGPYTPTSCA